MTEAPQPAPGEFDVRGAIKFFGGPAKLSRSIRATGHTLAVKTIERWQKRGSIPGKWLVHLAHLAASEGRKFEITDFIIYPKKENAA